MDKTLEQVMEEIKSGLTGNDEVDRDYLAQQMTKYRGNELGGAVARECTRSTLITIMKVRISIEYFTSFYMETGKAL